jgi:hypothetical protein
MRISLAGTMAFGLATLAGCGVGSSALDTADTVGARASGVIHGGPNPISGATLTLYATGSGALNLGYGIGVPLQTATSDANGNFTFAGGYTCPANQFAYLVATGGKTGSNAINHNSVLMTAIGPCSGVSASTFTWINELTTVAAGYALNNFMSFTGDAVHGYSVGIGAPPTNNAATGCVANAYYSGCTTTAAAGLKHAFANAVALVNPTTGQPNPTTATGALVPVQLINTLGNVLQACVNSGGGGTDATTGAPTTTTSAAGTTNDGTLCGKLFAYTSYTANGTPTGTLTAAGNTLGAIQNLAKRPSGSSTMFDSSCSSTAGTANTAATCIFNLGTPVGIYQTSMTAAPPDWILGISYPKGSFNTAANTTACGTVTPATNGLLYPYAVATDINDNITILNEDGSTGICYNLLTIGFDGSIIGGNGFDNTTAFPLNVALDSFGHAIVPAKGSTEDGLWIYSAGAGDSLITLATTVPAAAAATPVIGTPQYVTVDGNDNIFVSSRNAASDFGYLTASNKSHASMTYSAPVAPTGLTATANQNALDYKGAGVAITSSGSGTGRLWGIAPGGTTAAINSSSTLGGSTSSAALGLDNSGNGYVIISDSNTAPTKTVAEKFSYTATGGVFTFTTQSPGFATPTLIFPSTTFSQTIGNMDGNNVLWFAERSNPGTSGATVTPGHVTGYDTVNNFGTNNYIGCKFLTAAATVCGSTDPVTASSTPYLAYQTRGMAIDAAGDIWLADASQGQVNEIIGLAAPTFPLFIHNGVSNKP